MKYEIVLVDNHPQWGGETRILYGGELRDAIKKAGREMDGLLEGTVTAYIMDDRGVKLWDYEGEKRKPLSSPGSHVIIEEIENMTTKEALEFAKAWADYFKRHDNWNKSDQMALAHLTAMAEELEKVKAENKRILDGADKWMGKFNEMAKDMTEQRDAAHARERLSAQAYVNLCSERDKPEAELAARPKGEKQ